VERELTSLSCSRTEHTNAPIDVFKIRQEALSSVPSEAWEETEATAISNEKSVDIGVVQL
jgi:hypothetical protein